MMMARRASRHQQLSIRQVFLLLAILNGVVLGYLIHSAWSGIQAPSSGNAHAYTTLFLAVWLLFGVSISCKIVQRRVVKPLKNLAKTSYAIAQSSDDRPPVLAVEGNDEVATMASAFNVLLARERQSIRRLDRLNQELTAANEAINSSIQYAAILQRSILPTAQISEKLGSRHFLLWSPRDVVGGDHVVFYDAGSNWIIGVGDCAGHGVSGAMMTMLARAALDRAVQEVGTSSPAALLRAADLSMGPVLREANGGPAIGTSMDLALVCVDAAARVLRFSGAKMALYWCDGERTGQIRGASASIWGRRRRDFSDVLLPIDPACTYYMVSDGLLDQAGGDHGFALGTEQFCSWLQEFAGLDLDQQHQKLRQALKRFMAGAPQRDDITVLAFRP